MPEFDVKPDAGKKEEVKERIPKEDDIERWYKRSSEEENDPGIIPLVELSKRGHEEDERKNELENLIKQIASDQAQMDEYKRRKAEPIKDVPHGSWESPITSDVVCRELELQEIYLDRSEKGKGKVYYMQREEFDVTSYSPFKKERKEKFDPWYRGTIYCVDCSKPDHEREHIEWTPMPYKVEAVVHGTALHDFWGIRHYGGAMAVHDELVYFTTQHNIYRAMKPGVKMHDPLALGPYWHFADMCFGNDSLYAVHEKQYSKRTSDEGKPAFARIVRLSPAHQRVVMENRIRDYIYSDQTIVVEGSDFYASPRLNPDQTKLVYMCWDHPNMPWDATEIWTVDLDPDNGMPIEDSHRKILGDGKTNYMEPRWNPDGSLYVISDDTNWWNIYEVDMEKGELKRNINPVEAETGGPMWRLGGYAHSYDFDPNDGKRVAFESAGELYVQDLNGKAVKLDTGYATHRCIWFGPDDDIYCFAASPTKLWTLIRYVIGQKKVEVLKETHDTMDHWVERQNIDWKRYISEPEKLTIPTGEDKKDWCTAYYYPPKNLDYEPLNENPPVIIHPHGGPTDKHGIELDLRMQFFTSRGFAWCNVNYRGSSGEGRKRRDMLKGHWGEMDAEDTLNCAKYLIETKRTDPDTIYMFGESISGYTVMRANMKSDIEIAATMSHYGILDLEKLYKRAIYGHESDRTGMLKDADKFRSRYWQVMVGEDDVEECDLLRERSIVSNKEQLKWPIGFIYGIEDKMSRGGVYDYDEVWKAVKKHGGITTLLEFYDEGHGPFQKPGNRRLAIDGTYAYFVKIQGVPQSIKCGHGDGDPYERMFFFNVPGQEDPIDTFLPIGWATAPKDHC